MTHFPMIDSMHLFQQEWTRQPLLLKKWDYITSSSIVCAQCQLDVLLPDIGGTTCIFKPGNGRSFWGAPSLWKHVKYGITGTVILYIHCTPS